VTIDGDTMENVGVRKKGFFGSLSEEKPSLKVKFSEYDPNQVYFSKKRLTLNNAISDESYVKQCLGYDIFAAAGVPSPRCSFATVTVNGESLGVYVNVESLKKRFLRRHFSDDEGNFYEGALSDFREGWQETFQQKTNKQSSDRSDLLAMTAALATQDSGLMARLEPLLDLDAFYRFWASEYLVMHMDGYARNTNNFYLYNDPESKRFFFIPWGIDSIMHDNVTLPWETASPEGAVWVTAVLPRRLYDDPDGQARYFSTVEQLMDTVWDEEKLLFDIDQMVALITPHIPAEERLRFEVFVAQVRSFVADRQSAVEAELAIRPDYSGPLRDPWCAEPIGELSGTFNTTFDQLDVEDPLNAGSGTLSLTLGGEAVPFVLVSTLSGLGEENQMPSVRFVAAVSEEEIYVAEIGEISPDGFVSGNTVPIDWVESAGLLLKLDFSEGAEEIALVGMIGEGDLTLTAAGTDPGDAVTGAFQARVFEAIF
jgi:hypothetical protein